MRRQTKCSHWCGAACLLLAAAVCVSGVLAAGNEAAHWGERRGSSYEQLRAGFAGPDMIYAPFAFWFWDEPLQQGKAGRMAAKMMEQRLNPGYPHGRMSQAGTPDLPIEQWLSEAWFDEFERALDAAEGRGGYLGYVDEYWWPSGRAAGRVLKANPDLWAVSLRWETLEAQGGQTIELPASFFTVAARLVRLTDVPEWVKQGQYEVPPHRPAVIDSASLKLIGEGDSFTWKAPESGTWRVYSFSQYFHPGADGGRLNYLDPRVSEAFIKLAHEPYAARFGERMGRSIPGVFVDNEGDYGYKLAWSEHLFERYGRQWGADIRRTLPLMFDEDIEGQWARLRWQWFETVSDIYAEYLGGTSRWLERRGMYCISNLWEETLMWQAGAVGDFFKAQRAYSMPGTDCLGLNILKPHDFMETLSVCEFEGRRFMSEIMGAAGWWQFKPHNIKQAANAAAAWGISHVVPHGVYMTRTFDGHPWLPDWYDENPMWPYMHLWTDFVRRNSFINSHGHVAADVLVLSPMDSVWALCGPGVFDPAVKGRVPGAAVMPLQTDADIEQSMEELKRNSAWWCPPEMDKWFSEEVRHINAVYSDAMADLTAARVQFLIADRHYMRQMEVRGGRLMRGPFAFRTVVMPPMAVLPLDVAKKVVSFAEAGGRVYALGELPGGSVERGADDPGMRRLMAKLAALPTFAVCNGSLKDVLARRAAGLVSRIAFEQGAFDMLQQNRRIDGKDFFWLANNTHNRQECVLTVDGVHGQAAIWDCEKGEIRPIASQDLKHGSRVEVAFEPYEGYWLVFDPDKRAVAETPRGEEQVLAEVRGPWRVSIDKSIQPPVEHPVEPPAELVQSGGDVRELMEWRAWKLEGFSGYVDYRNSIELEKGNGKVAIDLGKVQWMAQVWVNGEDCGMRLWPPFRYDISGAIKPGTNDVHIRVGNLINDSYGQPNESGLFGPILILSRR
ncbi:MAG: glycosyl hydrolase [Anaerohalosphaeraceae bacterium]|jgi:hypothetical protein